MATFVVRLRIEERSSFGWEKCQGGSLRRSGKKQMTQVKDVILYLM
jgi:hypothetical protein